MVCSIGISLDLFETKAMRSLHEYKGSNVFTDQLRFHETPNELFFISTSLEHLLPAEFLDFLLITSKLEQSL